MKNSNEISRRRKEEAVGEVEMRQKRENLNI